MRSVKWSGANATRTVRAWQLRAALVSVLVLTGCTSQPATTGVSSSTSTSPATTTSSATAAPTESVSSTPTASPTPAVPPAVVGSVAPDGSASLVSQGYGVQLAAGTATGGELRLTPARASDVPGADAAPLVQRLGPAMDVELDGGDLSGPVTVSFPVPAYTPATTPLVVVWLDGEAGWQWLPTTRTGDVATAQTTQLSWGFLAMVDVTGFASQEATSFKDYMTGRAGVEKPVCRGRDQIRSEGTRLFSTKGDMVGKGKSVTWCLGRENGQQVLKLANNALTFQQVTYPATWTVVAGRSTPLTAGDLASAFGRKVPLPPGTAARILGSGDTLTLVVPPSPGGRAYVEPTWVSLALSVIVFDAREYASVVAATNSPYAAAAKRQLSDPAAVLGLTTGSASKTLKPCAAALSGVKSKLGVRTAQDIVYAGFRCVPDVMTNQLRKVQVSGPAAGLPLLATATSQVLSSVSLLFKGEGVMWGNPYWLPWRSSNSIFVVPASLLAQHLTFSGWAGITPGESIDQAAVSLGSVVHNACHGSSPSVLPAIDLPSSLPGIESGSRGGLGGDVVDSIVVSSKGIVGPDNIQVGDRISDHPRLTSGSRFLAYQALHSGPGTKTWVLKADHGWFFYMRGHVGDPKVSSFGLTSTRVLASGDEAGWNYCW